MKIVSWNTNGLRATMKQGFLLPLFQESKPDILCLQETKAEPDQLTEETKNVKGYTSYFSYSKLKKGYSGVAIYTKEKPKKIFYGMGIKKFDDEGRIVGVKLKNFTVINIYFPNGGQGPHRLKYKLEFYDAFLKFINKLRKNGEHIIFCGDVNTAHTPIDLAHPKANEENTGFLPIEREWISKVIKNNFIDVFRYFFPNKIEAYTYWDQKTRARERNVGWRLDYFFADSKLIPKINHVRSRPSRKTSATATSGRPASNVIKKTGMLTDYYGSDHCPIYLEM